MKKLLTFIVTGFLCLSMVACSSNNDPKPVETTTPNPTETTDGSLKVGLGSVTSMKLTSKSDDQEASTQYNTTYALVVLNEDGTIAQAQIDVAQNTVGFDGTAEAAPTKLEKKGDYGMQIASSLEKGEWFEQAAAFEEWCVGKTIAEIKSAELGQTGNGHGGAVVELASSCTMSAEDFIAALDKAASNAVDANGATTFGFASVTSLKSVAASEDVAASNGADTTISVVGMDGDKVKVVITDVAQNTSSMDADGVVTGEVAPTKLEKQGDYGMQIASSLEKGEWFERIAAFNEWCVGKTIAEITAAELGQTGNGHGGAVVELASSCTMSAEDFIAALQKAVEAAK